MRLFSFILFAILVHFASSNLRNATIHYMNYTISDHFVKYADLTLPLLHKIFTEVDSILVNVSNREINITMREFGHFTLSPGKACLSVPGDTNECCLPSLRSSKLIDEEGTPICGNFISQAVPANVGIGHFLAEYNTVIMDTLSFPGEVERARLTNQGLGHGLLIEKIDQVLGLNIDTNYNTTELTIACQKKYLFPVGGRNFHLGRLWRATSYNIWYQFSNRNRGNYYGVTRAYLRTKIAAQKERYPAIHKLVFPTFSESKKPLVTVHIRRGDVGESATDRFVGNSYYITVLKQIQEALPIFNLVVVSEGTHKDFADITSLYQNAYLMLDDDAMRHLVHLYYTDIIVCSKSGFSHIPAELGDSIVIGIPFWHTYSEIRKNDTVMTDPNTGKFDNVTFVNILKNRKMIV